MTKISCILPTYNRASWAIARIKEILLSEVDLEIIVVNDGGEGFEFSDPKVKIINLLENSSSVSIPRNIGITHSQGEYICNIDDDVISHQSKFISLSKLLDETDTELVFGQRIEIKNGVIINSPVFDSWNPLSPHGWGIDNGQIMYRRSVYEKIPLVFSKRACDWELAKKIQTISTPFISTREVVCTYIWHDKNRSLDDSTKIKSIYPGNFRKYFQWGEIPNEV